MRSWVRGMGFAAGLAAALCSSVVLAQPPEKIEAGTPPAAPPAPASASASASAPAPASAPASASASASASAQRPRLHHAPVSAAPSGEPLEIQAIFEHAQLIKYAGVVYRGPKGVLKATPFLRSVEGGYAAVIPAEEVTAPGLAYAIELELVDGQRVAVFASRSSMHPVSVAEERMDARERALYQRLGGRRSVFTASSEFVLFGKTTGARPLLCGSAQNGCTAGEMKVPEVDDQYWRVEAGYTYRPLRTVAEFSIRVGVVRGTSLVQASDYDEERYEVGLNYGSPSVRFRFADAWHMDVELLTSITETGFSVGAGNALLIGDPYGSKLTLGWQAIGLTGETYFGSRFYARMDIAAAERVTIAPMVEVTDMPRAEVFGVRLLGEASVVLGGGFSAGLRGGYQARKSTSGGPSFGGYLLLGF